MIDKEFLKGADLWVIPDVEKSKWRWDLEWSLNFQIAKSLDHHSQKLSEAFEDLIAQTESQELVEKLKTTSPWTMISTENLIPAKWLLVCGSIAKDELQQALDEAWTKLGKPQTRIFTSKTWTKDMLEGLKSKCVRDSSTEVF